MEDLKPKYQLKNYLIYKKQELENQIKSTGDTDRLAYLEEMLSIINHIIQICIERNKF